MPQPVTLTGRLVRLEPLGLEHLAELLAAGGENRESYGYTVVPAGAAAMGTYIEAVLADQARGVSLPFATRRLETDTIVGSTRFAELEYWDGRPPLGATTTAPPPTTAPSVAEIGYTWLTDSAQRTGCNTEAKLLMFAHAFETWRVHRVNLKTDARNTRSRTAIERLGAQFEGIRRAERMAVDGTVRDSAYYSVIAEEWPDVKARLLALLARAVSRDN